ncbi:uncharacterized protein LOC110719616 [Chenopodium quinoa]|uniref:uncharacterized protein LOC110719616 n=1 Tax=Chenopodium quinoa TaxID=63459 RepID=UPI000B776C67|nr:uncharacterized protein LOC110719616 [Chenopodium quinoa]
MGQIKRDRKSILQLASAALHALEGVAIGKAIDLVRFQLLAAVNSRVVLHWLRNLPRNIRKVMSFQSVNFYYFRVRKLPYLQAPVLSFPICELPRGSTLCN